jgi:ParB family chromosome partitioning protein
MTTRKRAAELVADVTAQPVPGATRRRTNLKALLGTEDGTYQLADARVLPVSRIEANPNQPRQTSWNDDKLNELADSIRARGILQPIRVRRRGDGYQIIAGERRFRAALLAGLTDVPAIVVDQEDDQAYIDSLIENVQREDLNPLDRAEALRQLRLNLGSVPWKEVGAVIGLSERSVFYLLNLSTLPDEMRRDVRSGELTEKHGRALHRLRQDPALQQRAYEQIVERRLSGDDALHLVKELSARAEEPSPPPALPAPDAADEIDAVVARLKGAVASMETLAQGRLPKRRRQALLADLQDVEKRLLFLRSRLAE